MSSSVLIRGTDAIAEAAIRAGCTHFFGYPITPQSELLEYMAANLPKSGGVFLQSEDETAAIYMVYGAAAAGARTMTASSGPGISLMAEGFSYLAAAELPCVIVDVQRGGPGLGNISPSQSDYSFVTKGAGHGDFKFIVLAPSSVQEASELTMKAFEIADKYRNPVLILTDGVLGEMMEKVCFNVPETKDMPRKEWATTGAKGRRRNHIYSWYGNPEDLETHNLKIKQKYDEFSQHAPKCELYNVADADCLIISFGICGRICRKVVTMAREKGMKVGLIRPVTLCPFPSSIIYDYAKKARSILVVEMNFGQMLDDVNLAIRGSIPVHFYGRSGGIVPTPSEIFKKVEEIQSMVDHN